MFIFIFLSLPAYGIVLAHGYEAAATKAGFDVSSQNNNSTDMRRLPDISCYVSNFYPIPGD